MSDNIHPLRQNEAFSNQPNPYQIDTYSNTSASRSSQEHRFNFACPLAKASPTSWIWECGLTHWPSEKLKDGLRHHLTAPNSSHRKMNAVWGPGDPRHVDERIFQNLDQWNSNTRRKAWDGKGAVQTWTHIYNICRGLPYDAANTTVNPYWSKSWVRETIFGDTESHIDPSSLPQRDFEINKTEDAVRVMRSLASFARKSISAHVTKIKHNISESIREFRGLEQSIKRFERRWRHRSQPSNSVRQDLAQHQEHDLQGFGQQEKANWGQLAPIPLTASDRGLEVLMPHFTVTSPHGAELTSMPMPDFDTVLEQHEIQDFGNEYHNLSGIQPTADQNPDTNLLTTMPQMYPQEVGGQQYYSTNVTDPYAQPSISKQQYLSPEYMGRQRASSMNNIRQAQQYPQSPRPRSFHDPPSQPFKYNDTTQPQLAPSMIDPSMLDLQWSEPQQQYRNYEQLPPHDYYGPQGQ